MITKTSSFRTPLRATLAAIAATLLVGLAAPAPALANSAHVQVLGYGTNRTIDIDLNKSVIVDLPANVAEVIVSQPAVAGTIMRSTRRAVIQGVGQGDTNIFFLDEAGRTITVIDVQVKQERGQVGGILQDAIARIIPNSAVKVESVTLNGAQERVVLSGTVASGDDASRAMQIAAQFAGSADNVANLIHVAGGQQIMLEVVISEIRRDVAQQLGINLSGSLTAGAVNIGFNNTTGATTSNGATANFPIGGLNLDASIQALQSRNALRVLAQPTLTAMSGMPANFLVGGELRYQSGTDNNGNPLFSFRDYGVSLNFTPTVKSNGIVGLVVDTEVSEPNADNSLTKRQASTTVEIPVDATLAIGGLLDERTTRNLQQLPGLGNIPILGALFRSTAFQTFETELVILVTPRLAQSTYENAYAPSFVDGPLPTDRSVPTSDAEAVFLGKLEDMYGVSGGGHGMRGSLSGSVGFVLD
jgi:pilus assembly protein CpaC